MPPKRNLAREGLGTQLGPDPAMWLPALSRVAIKHPFLECKKLGESSSNSQKQSYTSWHQLSGQGKLLIFLSLGFPACEMGIKPGWLKQYAILFKALLCAVLCKVLSIKC